MVSQSDENYPAGLRHIGSPPPLLYVKGCWPLMSRSPENYLAIVGTRRASRDGQKLAYELARASSSRGLVVVSGLAYGIDAAAHNGALSVGGWTVAVMGTGLDQVYPASHASLAQKICGRGFLLTEFPPGTPSLPQNFPRRNRLISGLSAGVIVIDASYKSGAMITAKFAADQGREVMAVPGAPGDPLSEGPNWLIKQGAALVENIDDIWLALGRLEQVSDPKGKSADRPPAPPPDLSTEELLIWRSLMTGPVCVDEIVAASKIPVAKVAGLLLGFELKGLVQEEPGKKFSLASKKSFSSGPE